jgi:hypothetical protein
MRRPARTRRSCSGPPSGAGYVPASRWALARSNAPAGSTLALRPRDLVAFARMHLEDGRAADGTRVLAPGTAARMHDREVGLPGSAAVVGVVRLYDLQKGKCVRVSHLPVPAALREVSCVIACPLVVGAGD